MSDDKKYNGWTNRETWAIQLHLSNNEGDYRAMCEQAEEYVRDCRESHEEWNTAEEEATYRMADYIKEWTEEVFGMVTNPEDGPPSELARMFVSDVGSWWRADFQEIAEHWISDAVESIDA